MKVLVLCPEVPYPLHGGFAIRQFNLLKHLAEDHEIDLLCLAANDAQISGVEEMRKFCRRVECVDMGSTSSRPIALARRLFGRLPYFAAVHDTPAMVPVLEDMLAKCDYDVIQIEYSFLAHYSRVIRRKTDAPMLLTVQDFLSFKYARDARHARGLVKRLYAARESRRWRKSESRLFPKFDGILTPSNVNQKMLSKSYPDLRIDVIENGADTENLRPLTGDDGKTICFVGGLQYRPNQDALHFFLGEVLPKIEERYPQVELTIVGKNPPNWLNEIGQNNARITVTGFVESVIPHLDKAAVMIVPLLTGGGTRLKILESFACGKAVVSTSVGAEGIECESGKHILLADEPEEMCDAICRLLESPWERKALGEQGRQLVERKYSWPVISRKLGTVWESLRNSGEASQE